MQLGVSRSQVELGRTFLQSFVWHMPCSVSLLLAGAGEGLPVLTDFYFFPG